MARMSAWAPEAGEQWAGTVFIEHEDRPHLGTVAEMTPEEARSLANDLLAKADFAEKAAKPVTIDPSIKAPQHEPEWDDDDEPTYRIVRFFSSLRPKQIIREGVSLAEAKEHCQDPESSVKGEWFDGFEAE